MKVAYIIPTRDRPNRLAVTLEMLGRLANHPPATVHVIDNASAKPVRPPKRLPNGLRVETTHLLRNEAAAARNLGARNATDADWLVMLDDDSHPLDIRFIYALAEAGRDVAALQAEVFVPRMGCREAGGLPEVFIGCGVAIRRQAFLEVGGYDPSFGFYAEEYDLAAKLILGGWRTAFDRRFRVAHHKDPEGRNFNLIARRLVRNNGWVALRYAPKGQRLATIRESVGRYAGISIKERAARGYTIGLLELIASLGRQPRREMPTWAWERFTGLAAARTAMHRAQEQLHFGTAALVETGKAASVIERAVIDSGARIVEPQKADALVIGTLSPGPMLDAWDRYGKGAKATQRIILPWADIEQGNLKKQAKKSAA